MKKNVAGQKIGGHINSVIDGSAFSGSVTVYVTGDAGSQAVGSVGSGACTNEGNGYFTYAPAQAETNYDLVAFTFIGTNAVSATVQVFTNFPQTGDSFDRIGAAGAGLTNIDLPNQTMDIVGNITGNLSGSVGSVTAAVGITSNRKKAATATLEFLMQDSTTGAPETGLTVTATISKDGAAPASTTNAVTEIGLGQYQIVLTATEMTANNIFLQFTAAGAMTYSLSIQTQP